MYKIRSGPDYTVPISPRNTQLVLLDYAQERTAPLAPACLAKVVSVMETAVALDIPILVTLYRSTRISQPLMGIGHIPVIEREHLNLWHDARLAKQLEQADLPKLVLLGADVASLCLTALDALRNHYDVYIVWDAVFADDLNEIEIARQRLTQAGAIPLSAQLLLGELTLTPATVIAQSS